MEPGALLPYERALCTGSSLDLRYRDGRIITLDVPRWLAPADRADQTVIDNCVAPVLDIGCGPGRMLAALQTHRIDATGIDIARQAVQMARRHGLVALRRNVFFGDPRDGTWATGLLLDGNIGIGGDPQRLLARVTQLLAPRGRLVVETHADDQIDERSRFRFAHNGGAVGPSFAWAQVGLSALAKYAARAELSVRETWTAHGRTFALLTAG